MKKFFIAIMLVLAMVAISFGAEQLVEGTVTDVVQATDQNGNDYTRLIVDFNRTIEGTEYTVGLPVMGFGNQAEPAAAISVGATLKAICSKRIFNDRESFTIIKILE